MINTKLLNSEVQKFINKNLYSDIDKILLKKSPFEGISSAELAEQISSKIKCKTKLPLWFQTQNILFPKKISIEQTSSEPTALYKSKLVQGTILDATGGLGVDSFYFSKTCKKVIHCEYIPEIQEIAKHNFNILQANNITSINTDFLAYLTNNQTTFDYIYLDPARRSNSKEKVFLLKDCQPNLPKLLPLLWQFTSKILVKTSPILDIQSGLKELENVTQIHIVALHNEVKETLFLLEKNPVKQKTLVKTINILPHSIQEFSFFLEESYTSIIFSEPQQYLYEPNSSLMKSGGFSALQKKYGFAKLAQHSHLFTSNEFFPNFEGRIFKIDKTLPFSNQLKKEIMGQKTNVSIRNFPLSVAQIREKFKLKEGGNQYCFFTTTFSKQKIVIICQKVEDLH